MLIRSSRQTAASVAFGKSIVVAWIVTHSPGSEGALCNDLLEELVGPVDVVVVIGDIQTMWVPSVSLGRITYRSLSLSGTASTGVPSTKTVLTPANPVPVRITTGIVPVGTKGEQIPESCP